MKLIRFSLPTEPGAPARFGALLPGGEQLLDFTHCVSAAPNEWTPLAWLDMGSEAFQEASAIHREALENEGRRRELEAQACIRSRSEVALHAPIPRPGKVICIGLNYRDHAEESGMEVPESPVVFSKFPTSVTGPGQAVCLPLGSKEVDYEAELGVVIGRKAKRVTREAAYDHVLGYVNVNDVSARDFQFRDGQWQRGKSCDTFAPVGEYIATKEEIPDPHVLDIRFRLNGKTLQDSNTNQLIFGIPELVAFLSETITLEPGDLIATGTPPGVGFARKPPVYLKDGDQMEVEIEGLGVLANPVVGD